MREGWIVVTSWDKFQHYKDRNAVWMKLYFELNSRDDWRLLTFAQRGLLVSIWLEYGRSNARLRAKTLWGRVGHGDKHGNLEALTHAGFVTIVDTPNANHALALTRSREKKYLRTSSKRERRPLAEAAADAPPEKEETLRVDSEPELIDYHQFLETLKGREQA